MSSLTTQDISSQLDKDTPVASVSKSMFRTGNRIDISFSCTLNQALSHGSAILKGLPIPKDVNSIYMLCASNNSIKYPIEFKITGGNTTRFLSAFYPQNDTTGNGSVITGVFSYIAES